MRILHTSDWHLGQTFHHFDRTFEHQAFLGWLLDTIQAQEIDVLVVAGDVFDSGNPPMEAQKLYYEFLYKISQRFPSLNVVITAGNHDSPGRLEAPKELLSAFRVHVVGSPKTDSQGRLDPEPVVVPLQCPGKGLLGWCIAMPFLRGIHNEDLFNSHYDQAIHYAQSKSATALPILAMGHAHFSGSQLSDTERKVLIGGMDTLPTGVFENPALSYVALGHLHRSQRVRGRENWRYCGSPIPLSFSETHYQHGVVVAHLTPGGCTQIQEIPIPRSVELIRVPSQEAGAEEMVLAQLKSLNLAALTREERPYLEVRVSLKEPSPHLRARVEEALQNQPVRLAKLEVSYPKDALSSADSDQTSPLTSVASLQPEQVLERLYYEKYKTSTPSSIAAAYSQLLADVYLEKST